MSGRRALRRAASLAEGAEQTRGERGEATRSHPPVRRARAWSCWTQRGKRQACLILNYPKLSHFQSVGILPMAVFR